jgi:hypothetical protein
LGLKLQQLDFWGPLREQVKIAQKTVRYTPVEKLTDLFIALLAGARGIAAINQGLRTDPALQRAFGRTGCAEQSVLQDTLDACTPANVAEVQAAYNQLYRTYSRGFAHDYQMAWQLLDVDLSGLPCGRKAAVATPGYFGPGKRRRGRQLGRVVASRYGEIVVDQVLAGNTTLATALPALVEAAEQTLALDDAQRARTVIRVDAGGGSVGDINWLLERGYQVIAKDYSSSRAARLAASVTHWYADPKVPGRQFGRVEAPATEYVRPVVRLAVRCPKRQGGHAVSVLVLALPEAAVWELHGQAPAPASWALLQAAVHLYDQRGGGVETSLRGSKSGLGLTKRNKKRLPAQQVLVLLSALVYNLLLWARAWLADTAPARRPLGIQRLVRDLWGINGVVELDPQTGQIVRIILNHANRFAQHWLLALATLVAPQQVALILGET